MNRLLRKLVTSLLTAAAVVIPTRPVLAGQQPDVLLAPVGGGGGNPFEARCAPGEHLLGVNLRAGHDIDAVQPICGSATSPTGPTTVGREMPRFGGSGGDPKQLLCPPHTPVVHAMSVAAEGRPSPILNSIAVFCGVAGPQQHLSEIASATFEGPYQNLFIPAPFTNKRCPSGLVAVGVHGRAGARVDALGLICGMPQIRTDETAGRTLGKRKLPDDTAGRTLGKRRRPGDDAATTSGAATAIVGMNLDRYVGRYLLGSNTIITITRQGNTLFAAGHASMGSMGSGVRLVEESEAKFSFTGGASTWTITFERDASGKVVALVLGASRAVKLPN